MTLLKINNLGMRFGGLRALEGIDLEVDRGQIFGVIGPNGSGKTTLFNVITGIYHATGGSVYMDGVEITHKETHEIARLGISRTFQHSRVIPDLSVLDNILLGFYGHRHPTLGQALFCRRQMRAEVSSLADRAAELSAIFSPGLIDHFFQRAGELTYIDRRRVEICRALATGARLLFLDEPTAGMSPEETHELIADIYKVRETRPELSIIIIEHDMSVIGRVSDRVACFNYGRKIAEGNFAEVAGQAEVRAAYLGGEIVA